jgi:hypothetical protein
MVKIRDNFSGPALVQAIDENLSELIKPRGKWPRI